MSAYSPEQLDFLESFIDDFHHDEGERVRGWLQNSVSYVQKHGIWQTHSGNKIFKSLSALYADSLDIHRGQAVIDLALKFGHSPENGFSYTDNAQLKLEETHFLTNPSDTPPANLQFNRSEFHLFHTFFLSSPGGRKSGLIGIYTYNNIKFFCVAFRGQGHEQIRISQLAPEVRFQQKIRLGTGKAHTRITNEDTIREHPQAAILLFEDPVVASAVQKLTNAAGGLIREEDFLISTWFGGFNSSPFIDPGALVGRKVYFIPAAYDRCLQCALEYKKSLGKVVESWNICTLPIAFRDPIYPELCSDWGYNDEYSGRLTLFAKDHFIVPAITRASLPQSRFASWLKTSGIQRDDNTAKRSAALAKPLNEILKTPAGRNLSSQANLDQIISPGNITIVVGHSNAGKSFFILNLLAALNLNKSIFCFAAGTRHKTSLLFDIEAGNDLFRERCDFTAKALGLPNFDTVCMDVFLQRDSISPISLNIAEEESRLMIEREIAEKRPSVVCFDSLSTICPRQKLQGNWFKLTQWFVSLERKYGVAIILCHHTNRSGEVSGTSQIEDFAQNLFFLKDPRHKKKETKSDSRKEDFAYIDEDEENYCETDAHDDRLDHAAIEGGSFEHYLDTHGGVLIELTIAKCKENPNLTGKKFGYYLPRTSEAPYSTWKFIPLGDELPNFGEDFSTRLASLAGKIDREEHAVMAYAYQKKQFIRKEIEDVIQQKRSKCGNVLTKLRSKGLLSYNKTGNTYSLGPKA